MRRAASLLANQAAAQHGAPRAAMLAPLQRGCAARRSPALRALLGARPQQRSWLSAAAGPGGGERKKESVLSAIGTEWRKARADADAAHAAVPPEEREKKPSRWQQLKTMFKEYRWVFVCYWTGTWIAGVVPIYCGLELAGLDGVAVLDQVQDYLALETRLDHYVTLTPSFVNALVAIEINELGEVVRLPFVVGTTPAVARWWRSRRGGGGGGAEQP